MRFAGELAALGTAVCWASGGNLFAAAAHRLGPAALNRLRLAFGLVFLAGALLVTRGTPWPTWATPFQLAVLGLSGLIGFVFGDYHGFRAMVILGPGRASLVFSLAPLFTLLLAWPLLGERPGRLVLLGVALLLAGLAWVLLERAHETHEALSGTLLPTLRAARADRGGTAFAVAGAFAGPFLGVTLSLVALQTVEAGVAASITAINPVLAILIAKRFHGERLTARLLLGALVAVAGVVVLFLR